MELKNFAQRLKSFRKGARLTQEDLAEKINVSVMTVKRWEWGKRQPRMEDIKNLCEVLHVTEAELLKKPFSSPSFVIKRVISATPISGGTFILVISILRIGVIKCVKSAIF